MNSKIQTSPARNSNPPGFALVVTLSLMILLTIIAVGLLTLSSISLRASSRGQAMDIARANARMALMLALGDLQEVAGPDTRVTATSDAVAGGNNGSRFVTGAWRSWEGNDHNKASGLPLAPDYTSKLETGELDPSSTSAGRFLGWLVSGPENDNDANKPPSVVKGVNKVPLLATGTLGSGATDKEVYLLPTLIGNEGAYAWWIEGENTKALIAKPGEEPTTDAEWSQRLASNGQPDVEEFGFDQPAQLLDFPTRKTMDLASNSDTTSKSVSGTHFHDMTAISRGLLTNTANGGWRRDLTLMAEKWYEKSDKSTPVDSDFIPGNIFTLEPGKEISASLTIASNPGNASIYPWAGGDGVSMSWNALADYAALYKRVKKNSASQMPYFDTYTHLGSDRITIDPVMARIHWTLGFAAQKFKNTNRFSPSLAFKSTVTMWNPYNVAIEDSYDKNSKSNGVELQAPISKMSSGVSYFPINVEFKLEDVPSGTITTLNPNLAKIMGDDAPGYGESYNRLIVSPKASSNLTWKPGESRIYSSSNGSFTNSTANNAVTYMNPGYRIIDGSMSKIDSSIGKAGTTKYTATYDYNVVDEKVSTVIRYQPNKGQKNEAGERFNALFQMSSPIDEARAMLPLPPLLGSGTTFQLANNEPVPFLNIIYSLRLLADSSFVTKGYSNTKPITQTKGAAGDTNFNQSSYEWLFVPTTTWDGPGTPESDDGAADGEDGAGYIGTTYRSSGIPRWAIAELPTQPLLSLCELQHFDAGYNNVIAPRVANAIGNSSAAPDISPDQVTRVVPEGTGYDHSYVGNHLFFDDWFVSSICQDFDPYSPSVKPYSAIEDVYAAHLTGTTPLTNSHYKPAVPRSATDAPAVASALLADEDVWRNVASELEVEGMFNINSTSVAAWTALLKHQRNGKIPELSVQSGKDDWKVNTVGSSDSPVSRTTVATDPDTGSAGGNVVSAHPTLTDKQIETLAEQIVGQIKLRGPFLSLSEFVNRQLSNNKSLALAGAIETALDNMSTMGASENPFFDIKAKFPATAVASSSADFPEAAKGSVAYGTPGWMRQADVLRPLAPILSARDDTFTIRAYGEARDKSGTVTARSWCEAVVQRKAGYVDTTDKATVASNLVTGINKLFGRKFEIISFRWLAPNEV